jgi:hypothetical protein
MLEALWSVEFVSSLQVVGAGVAVLETGRVLVGDAQYYYVGTCSYDQHTDTVTAELKVTHYAGSEHSVFGAARNFRLRLSGKPNRERFDIHGHVVENPSLNIGIRLTRRAELP